MQVVDVPHLEVWHICARGNGYVAIHAKILS